MRLCTFLTRAHLEPRVGAIISRGKVLDLISWLSAMEPSRKGERIPTLYDLLKAGDTILNRTRNAIAKVEVGEAEPFISELNSVKILAPILRPPKIVAAIVNTSGMLGGRDLRLNHPRLDMKAPSTVIGPGETIFAPAGGIRPEVELAVVLAKRVSKSSPKGAKRAIFGYTILNDVTAPRESKEDAYEAYRRDPATGGVKKMRLRGPLFRSKNHDTFTPMGPWIVTSDELASPNSLRMTTRFNGKLIQEGNTSEYIFGAQELVSYVSHFLTLEPGDVVSMGSIGWKQVSKDLDPSEWILPSPEGELKLEIEGIGVLENPVRQERVG